jgi:hypothetical protein
MEASMNSLFVREAELHDLIVDLDEAIKTLEDMWADEDRDVTIADVSVRTALWNAADYLHRLHLQHTA